jgi:hypothetical protein
MTTLEDNLSDEERDDVEDAKLQSKREKTKYGTLVETDES